MLFFFIFARKQVQSQEIITFCEIKQCRLLQTMWWNPLDTLFVEISMWIQKTQSLIIMYLLVDHRRHTGGLSGSCFANDIQMFLECCCIENDLFVLVFVFSISENNSFSRRYSLWQRKIFVITIGISFDHFRLQWEMNDMCHLFGREGKGIGHRPDRTSSRSKKRLKQRGESLVDCV